MVAQKNDQGIVQSSQPVKRREGAVNLMIQPRAVGEVKLPRAHQGLLPASAECLPPLRMALTMERAGAVQRRQVRAVLLLPRRLAGSGRRSVAVELREFRRRVVTGVRLEKAQIKEQRLRPVHSVSFQPPKSLLSHPSVAVLMRRNA